jgi:2-C-methyl-D-erythritol 4-phosphate cytidylyltransferase
MGSEIPKQFLPLAGLPVLMHAILAFHNAVPDAAITVALPKTEFVRWKELQTVHGFNIPHTVVAGGATRFHSVKNALTTLPGEGIVAIHDGVRPLVSIELIHSAFREAEISGNAVPAVPVSESMRLLDETGNRPVDRSGYRLIQTPQVFRLADARHAFLQDYLPGFTDDATVLESSGIRINLIEGETRNIKITGPDDMAAAQALMIRPFQR